MANIVKPLHIACNQQVIEQNHQFHWVVSATMGVRLSTAEALLEFDFYKESFEYMGANPLPDLAMPKPQAEYIVSGSYYAPENKAVSAGEVKVRIGNREKKLFIFGPRQWQMGLPSKPEEFTSAALSYANAFGGNGFDNNPDGMGYEDSHLPLIENPDQLLTSNKQNIQPAGLSPLSPAWPQRTRYQGTYDQSYIDRYFPGYPEDFDWRFFMSTAQDQWSEEFFTGSEKYELHHLHPHKPVLSGSLPGYKTRCFIKQKTENKSAFKELKLNLDTLWFFPETDLALLIWRGGIQVADDEASSITDLLLAYESGADTARSEAYYEVALDKRLNSNDALLNNFNTSDLIPMGAKCAMELMQENALVDTDNSPFSDNLDAKTKAVQALVTEQLQSVNEGIEKNIDASSEVINKEQANIKEILKNHAETKPDPEIEALNKKLEAILPGITSGDTKKLKLKEFSFDKIDKILAVIDEFRESKQALALEELNKANKVIEDRLAEESKNVGNIYDKESENIKALIARLQEKPEQQEVTMPRMNVEEIQQSMSQLSPQLVDSMQQVQSMKSMGGDDENMRNMEKMISDMLQQQDQELISGLEDAEKDFKEMYCWSAHTMPRCASPHKITLDEVRDKLVERIRNRQNVSKMDWSCLDLSGMTLDGVDFSGAYLEQVDFSNASLKGCNFQGAILARAILNGADFSDANLAEANIGSVIANNTNFKNTQLKQATLSNGNFTNSTFASSVFEDVNMLDINIDGVDFTDCKMERMQFIKANFKNVCFKNALLTETVFLQCNITDTIYTDANMQRCIWSNTNLSKVIFDGADMASNCFAATEDESITLSSISFKGCCLDRANFQGMSMPKANFTNSVLTSANFSMADASYADFTNSSSQQALFRKATLTHSIFDRANVMEGSMAKAHLSGASFVGANLYAVDFLRSTMGGTDFSGANLDNTIIRDWQPS